MMERRASLSRSEAALERLLERIDDAIDEYNRVCRLPRGSDRRHLQGAVAPGEEASGDPLDAKLDAWWALPVAVRDWLLWTAPGWWVLPAGAFRQLLLTAAGFIVWRNMPTHVALRRAAAQLRLPPPRASRSTVPPARQHVGTGGRNRRAARNRFWPHARQSRDPAAQPARRVAVRQNMPATHRMGAFVRPRSATPRPWRAPMRRAGALRMGRVR